MLVLPLGSTELFQMISNNTGDRLEILNGALAFIDFYCLTLFLIYFYRNGIRSANWLPFALFVYISGHTIFRAWTWVIRHAVNHGENIDWIVRFPIWELGAIVITLGLTWLVWIFTRNMYGIVCRITWFIAVLCSFGAAILVYLSPY